MQSFKPHVRRSLVNVQSRRGALTWAELGREEGEVMIARNPSKARQIVPPTPSQFVSCHPINTCHDLRVDLPRQTFSCEKGKQTMVLSYHDRQFQMPSGMPSRRLIESIDSLPLVAKYSTECQEEHASPLPPSFHCNGTLFLLRPICNPQSKTTSTWLHSWRFFSGNQCRGNTNLLV